MCVEKKFAKEFSSGIEAVSYINPGNAFACNRMGIFDHYGIFVGWIDGVAWAIHFSGKILSETCIRFEKFLKIVGNSRVRVFGCSDTKHPLHLFGKVPCDPLNVLRRAMERLGDGEYNVATWNCESYVNWVFYHIGISSQSVKAAPKAVLVASVAMVNPIHTIVAGNLAKTFLDSSLRANTKNFLNKQNELKKKIEHIISTKGIQGLMETAHNSAVIVQTKEKGVKILLDKVREVRHTKHF